LKIAKFRGCEWNIQVEVVVVTRGPLRRHTKLAHGRSLGDRFVGSRQFVTGSWHQPQMPTNGEKRFQRAYIFIDIDKGAIDKVEHKLSFAVIMLGRVRHHLGA